MASGLHYSFPEQWEDLENRDWRRLKDEWLTGVHSFYTVDGHGRRRPLKAKTILYLIDVFLRVGNGGRYARGEYRYPALVVADRLGLAGSEKTRRDAIRDARVEALQCGFIREVSRGSGGGGYGSKCSTVQLCFDFRARCGGGVSHPGGVDAPSPVVESESATAECAPSVEDRPPSVGRVVHPRSMECGGPEGRGVNYPPAMAGESPAFRGVNHRALKRTGLIQGRDTGDSYSPDLRETLDRARLWEEFESDDPATWGH